MGRRWCSCRRRRTWCSTRWRRGAWRRCRRRWRRPHHSDRRGAERAAGRGDDQRLHHRLGLGRVEPTLKVATSPGLSAVGKLGLSIENGAGTIEGSSWNAAALRLYSVTVCFRHSREHVSFTRGLQMTFRSYARSPGPAARRRRVTSWHRVLRSGARACPRVPTA